jgi:ABC-type nickel/cobalt efflux system permease component RcnA
VSGVLVVAIGIGLARARLADLLRRPSAGRARLVPAPATVAAGHHHDDGTWHTHAHEDANPHDHHDHAHHHGDHGEHHHHGWFGHHDHGPNGHYHHLPERLSWRGLLALGISGGLVPCPSALVVLLGAIALHRVGFGLLLIVAFSAGLATVLTGIGLLLVMAGQLFARLPVHGPALRLLPLGSAILVTGAGMVLVLQALAEAGVLPV